MTDLSVNSDGSITLYVKGRKVLKGTLDQIIAHLRGPDAPKARPRKVRPKSRVVRWGEAAAAAVAAVEDLKSMQDDDFQPWKDGLPENLQSSAVGEKLDAVCDLDLDSALSTLQDAEGLDLPLGFGRD